MKQLTQREIGERYTLAARWYDFRMAFFEFLFLRKLRSQLLSHASQRVLEVGIGTGWNLRHYPETCEITGIDYTAEMLEKARQRAKKLQRNVLLKQGDAQRLPFKKESFDTVVDTFCLCTYPNPLKVLQEMKRVCKKGGQILLFEHGKSNNHAIERLQRWLEEPYYRSIGCHLLREHEALMRKTGLEIIESKRRFFGVFYVIRARCSVEDEY